MTPRAKARTVLAEAREILAERLAEQVLEAAEAILDDARGDSYMNEIDEVYERVGLRLVHVSQMLSHFPEEAPPSAEPAQETATQAEPTLTGQGFSGAIMLGRVEPATETRPDEGSRPIILPQLMRPRLALPHPTARPREAKDTLTLLAVLAAQVQAGELADAAATTSELLGLAPPRAAACVRVYHRRQALDPEFVAGSMLLVPAIEAARLDDALPLLSYCFGLEPTEAVAAFHRLRAKSGEAA